MSEDLREFLTATLANPGASWSGTGLRGMARLPVPDRTFRWAGDILRGDIHRQWAEWMLGTFCDVAAYAVAGPNYADIYADVKAHVAVTWTEMDPADQKLLAREVARLALAEAQRRAAVAARAKPSVATRQQLLDLAKGTPHCWICGWRFSEAAVALFLDEPATLELPPLVDVFKPIGLKRRHLQIEVDHVTAHSRGGSNDISNLRLSCGWCNAHKSNRSSIYEVSGDPRPTANRSPRRQLPQPFWVVRLLALEAAKGGLSTAQSELSVALRNPKGGLSPANLMVVAYSNDPMGAERFQGRATVERLWSGTQDPV